MLKRSLLFIFFSLVLSSSLLAREPYVMMPDTVYAHIMIPVESYYDYQD